ncbi:MAG: ribulose-phosphate 3-epimerase [Acidimicrobiales bacterium]|jgi:ribulose-phosphate 3-epimerase|nr:ribulose-phosphate 3-epimerase [Acidimicrobiales bacterium]MDP6298008.1 ribulose-phosphate 3-epimerase [Acidimicrobiales bacterium]HJM28461.1 ribulose-phosphate 3-epimerase [Acidimicrobiales bacterium]HJM96964.1 ribulose-phosphate 3-epimerase [Acidimicrobiales bacterium]
MASNSDALSIEICPSILPADFSRLGEEVKMLEDSGADRIHWDVMDGNFVPNLTVGPDVVASCRKCVTIPFEAHLMVEDPDLLAPLYVEAGCDLIMVHVESVRHLDRTLNEILKLGAKAGVTLNPSTPLETIENVIHLVDQVLIMSVNPGFGGQKYLASQEPKITKLRNSIAEQGHAIDIEIDGGINEGTISQATSAGANIFVAGSAIFNHPEGPASAISALREIAVNT